MTYNVKHLWSIVSASTIRGEIVFATAAFTVLPLLFATIYFFPRINDLVEDRLSKYGEELVTHTENSLRTAIHQTDFISQQITYWAVTHRLLTSSVDRPRHWVRAIQSTQQFVSNLTFAFPLLSGVFVVGEDGRVFTGTYSAHTSRLVEKPWIRAAIDAGRGEWVVPPHVVDYQDRLPTGPTETVFSYVRGITDYTDGRYRGAIQIDIRLAEILTMLDSAALGPLGGLYLVSKDGHVATAAGSAPDGAGHLPESIDAATLPTGTSRMRDTIVIKRELERSGWYLLAFIPPATFAGEIRSVSRTFAAVMAAFAAASGVIALVVAGRITRPLATLVASITRFGDGHLAERVPSFANRDLRALSDQFNRMANRVERLLQEIVEEERQKDRAEIRALQAQINPHFLYNTLETIRGIALAYGVTDIGAISKSLASIFRYSIDREREAVTIQHEIDNIEHYVTILSCRYGDRFTFTVDVPEAVRHLPAVRLALQPIVENAFVHGIEGLTRHGEVRIAGDIEGATGVIRVIDNGDGMDTHTLHTVRAALAGDTTGSDDPAYGLGVGLINVHRRLELAFGRRYGLSIESHMGVGTTVALTLPRETTKGVVQ